VLCAHAFFNPTAALFNCACNWARLTFFPSTAESARAVSTPAAFWTDVRSVRSFDWALARVHSWASCRKRFARAAGVVAGPPFARPSASCCSLSHTAWFAPAAKAVRGDRLVLTLENHSVVGGLSEAVAATVAFAGVGTRVVPVALPDEFLAAGALPTLHDRYGLSTDSIVTPVRGELAGQAS